MFDAIIIANGEIPAPKYWQGIQHRAKICTDGAAHTLYDLGLSPDVIIGDMDSISETTSIATLNRLKMQFPECKIHRIEDQESTDFEKALFFVHSEQLNRILCIGAMGKSADHELNNLCLLSRFSQELELMLLHTFDDYTQWIFPLRSNTSIYTQKDTLLSFFPLPLSVLTSEGLNWELTNTILSITGKSGVRNITTRDIVRVKNEGHCLCFVISEVCPRVIYEKP